MNKTGTDIESQPGCCKTDIVETNENNTGVSQMKGLTLPSQDSYRETLDWEVEQMPYRWAQTGAN